IAMGTRGRSGLASLVLGSVARGILHGSHTSLLVAPSRAR
ncbi:MAG: universal stress protein, partial [Deltaproteobacteria bacterium]|nr:universal stress protein [Deltaproteobacteria bacterium]